jgi:hypothetical protein
MSSEPMIFKLGGATKGNQKQLIIDLDARGAIFTVVLKNMGPARLYLNLSKTPNIANVTLEPGEGRILFSESVAYFLDGDQATLVEVSTAGALWSASGSARGGSKTKDRSGRSKA